MTRSGARIRISFSIVVALLFCTLATLELPELINLTDNTSNDYSLTVFQHRDGATARNHAPRLLVADASAEPNDERPIPEVRFFDLVHPLPDPLRMLCVLRT